MRVFVLNFDVFEQKVAKSGGFCRSYFALSLPCCPDKSHILINKLCHPAEESHEISLFFCARGMASRCDEPGVTLKFVASSFIVHQELVIFCKPSRLQIESAEARSIGTL
jgi:hypothetical protein